MTSLLLKYLSFNNLGKIVCHGEGHSKGKLNVSIVAYISDLGS